jgi:hypothetical protein
VKDEAKGALNKVKLDADIRAAIERKRRAVDAGDVDTELEDLIAISSGFCTVRSRTFSRSFKSSQGQI